jgi:hypothetical protein
MVTELASERRKDVGLELEMEAELGPKLALVSERLLELESEMTTAQELERRREVEMGQEMAV